MVMEGRKEQLQKEINKYRKLLVKTTRKTNGEVRQGYIDEINIRKEELDRIDLSERESRMKIVTVEHAPTGTSFIGDNTTKGARKVVTDDDIAAQIRI